MDIQCDSCNNRSAIYSTLTCDVCNECKVKYWNKEPIKKSKYVAPITYNIDLYRSLPEGLKHLCIPLKAYNYCYHISKGPLKLLEKTLFQDLYVSSMYFTLTNERLPEEVESLMLKEAKESTEGDLPYTILSSYVNSLLRLSNPSTFEEGIEFLAEKPSEILGMSRSKNKRMVKYENTLFHDFSSSLEYIIYNFWGSSCPKFEKFINGCIKKYKVDKTIDLDKIRSVYGFPQGSNQESTGILSYFLKFDKSLRESLSKQEDASGLIKEAKSKSVTLGSSLINSFHNGMDYLVDYCLHNKGGRWKEIEFLFTPTRYSLDYLERFVDTPMENLETRHLFSSIPLTRDYLKALAPKVKNFTSFENNYKTYVYNRLKRVPEGKPKYLDREEVSIIRFYLEMTSSYNLPVGESMQDCIMFNSELSFKFATEIKKGRFIKGEVAILRDLNLNQRYLKLINTKYK